MMSHFRQCIRSLTHKPAFAIAALLTIALGIGVNTAVYAVVHAVLLEPLPFRQPRQLVQVWETHPELHNLQVSVADYLDWKSSVKTLDLAAYSFQAMNKGTLTGQGDAIAVQGTNASPELFPLLGIQPLIGRVYTAGDGKQPVALISESLWRHKFSADPQVIGRPLHLGPTSLTIVGVLRRDNAFPVWADLWIPLSRIDPELYATRKYHPLEVIGRLKPGVPLSSAEIELETMAHRLSANNPATNGKIGSFVVPLMDTVVGAVRPAILTAWIAVALVLLIACANLAHLMLGRALNRRREIALRLALGAGRLAVLRTFLLETVVLSVAGGVLGMLTAHLALPLIERLAQDQIPRLTNMTLNTPVFLFALLASLLVAAFFALPSCLQIVHSDLTDAISSGNARGYSGRRSRLSTVLMSAEVAVSLAVLLAAIGLVRSFSLTLHTDPGFRPANVLIVHSPLVATDWLKSYDLFRNRIAPELADVPGVREVAAVNSVPLSLGATEHTRFATRFGIAGTTFPPGRFPTAQIRWCTPNYFHVVGIPLISGRMLTNTDHNQPRYLINQAFARQFFPHSNPVGRKLLLDVLTPHPESVEIVGVVGDVRDFSLNSAPEAAMYLIDTSPEMDIVLKTTASAATFTSSVTAAMRRINPLEAVSRIQTLEAYVNTSLARQKFILTLISSFAALAILLSAIGINGVFNYSIARRMREFGIRSAIGADRRELIAQVLRECLAVIVPGLVAGLAIAAASSQLLRTLLYRVSPMDPLSSALATICVLAFATASVLLPALRAARADPATILREQ